MDRGGYPKGTLTGRSAPVVGCRAVARGGADRGARRWRGHLRRRLARRLILFHAGLEGFDAFGKIAHQARDLALAAEQNHDDGDKDENMPKTQCTHGEPRSDNAIAGVLTVMAPP